MSSHLRRHLAPVTELAWAQIHDEAERSLRLYLGGRTLVDVAGPIGWDVDAVTQGFRHEISGADEAVSAYLREPLPMIEFTTSFEMSLADMDTADRGNTAIDTTPVILAAQGAARAEEQLIFSGLAPSRGIVPSTPNASIPLGTDPRDYAAAVAQAVQTLRDLDIDGPYALALGDSQYTQVLRGTERGGFPLRRHLEEVLAVTVQWVPSLQGGVLITQRGGDYRLTLGQDFAIGFRQWQGDRVDLYLQQSLAFQVLTDNAAVHLPVPS